MARKLVIVESPAKAKKIGSYLGDEYIVDASVGHIRDLPNPSELPPEMISFKQQAHRWTKGSVQTCCKLLPKILRSKLPYRIKSEAFFHLTNTIVYPLMVFVTLMIYPTFYGYFDGIEAPLKNAPYGRALLTGSLFILATCSASTPPCR